MCSSQNKNGRRRIEVGIDQRATADEIWIPDENNVRGCVILCFKPVDYSSPMRTRCSLTCIFRCYLFGKIEIEL